MKKLSLVVLISGSGSNLQAIIDAIQSGELNAEIRLVISNRADAGGLQRAEKAGIETRVIDHKHYPDRESFDRAMIAEIDPLQPDLVILAGFMRILSPAFIEHFEHRLLNIHPSLLPRYKGLNTHQQAIDNSDAIHGASVHFVNVELDSGPLVIQAEVPVLPGDDAKTLAARVLEQEHRIYPLAIKLYGEGKLHFDNNTLFYEDQPLVRPLRWKDGQLITPEHV
ncbi:MAG TPA: phosphoribosylglycinamide formyltransferase [Gammaproteobacteria bacterium]|nr:phosphoribosylglycinamide formyltransferase [Gammaproteobacteria bacterium]